ncbi:MAG: hypothetical protein Q7R80_03140 [bacterium]|nr:hypothetical protein [bacterium]MDP3771401.1 hypothetical protein [bacterium]
MRNGRATGQGGVVPIAAARKESNLDRLRRRRAELEGENRELALVAVREKRSPSAAERALMQANIREIGSIKDTLRAFGALYQ